jgi:alginate O-acetyltransferase complex protein AlgJ
MHRCKTEADAFAQSDNYAQGWSRTVIARPVAVWLSVLFCAGLVAVPLADGLLGSWRQPARVAKDGISKVLNRIGSGGWRWFSVVDANNAALETIRSFESSLEDSSALAAAFRPEALDGLLRVGGAGSEEAYIGRDGWLFYRPDVDTLVMKPHGDSGAAKGIADFASELAQHGVRLLVVSVPGKATIHPEKLAAEGMKFAAPVASPVLSQLAGKVAAVWRKKNTEDTGLAPRVLDATAILWQRKMETGEDQFLRADSHWAPLAMGAVADLTAKEIAVTGISAPPENIFAERKEILATGDTALMLDLPVSSPLRERQSVSIEQIKTGAGNPWRANRGSPVLVLGDSYSNIYSTKGLGWGADAGFAEQLSFRLGYRVDKLARNDAGARSAREMLVAEMARNPGWLEGKKVVVWVMAAREFVRGDWSRVRLPEPSRKAEAQEFLVVPPGETAEVTALVLSLGAFPVPGDSPYADYLTALHLGELEDAGSGRKIPGQALAYLFTMRDRQIFPVPGLAPGQRVKLRLSNYAEKSDKLDSLNRGYLDDLGVMMEQPNFAEWIAPQ